MNVETNLLKVKFDLNAYIPLLFGVIEPLKQIVGKRKYVHIQRKLIELHIESDTNFKHKDSQNSCRKIVDCNIHKISAEKLSEEH